MVTRLKHAIAESNDSEVLADMNHLIEQVWHDLDGQVPQARVRQVAIGVAANFHNATVTTYIPLFVRHLTREWLKEEIKGHDIKV